MTSVFLLLIITKTPLRIVMSFLFSYLSKNVVIKFKLTKSSNKSLMKGIILMNLFNYEIFISTALIQKSSSVHYLHWKLLVNSYLIFKQRKKEFIYCSKMILGYC